VLAGTREASELATLLAGRAGCDVVASLAGRTRAPATLPCPTRTGGFGGVTGLARALQEGAFDALVDATHPFARSMPHHAAEAAALTGVARLRLVRPPWPVRAGWREVATMADAARYAERCGARRVLLTIGRQELSEFDGIDPARLVVRTIDPPGPRPGAPIDTILARPPFTLDDERSTLAKYTIDTIVTRNSGGPAAKLDAAAELGVAVVVVRRPPSPAGPVAETAPAAAAWVAALR
jgi:precorrin-6A/cobalt-precorrin-6A reductase